MLRLLLLGLLLKVTSQQPELGKLDPELLQTIFGTPTSESGSTEPNPEDITVRPTDGSMFYKDRDGEDCKCVPYYLCDRNTNMTVSEEDLARDTGFGQLDIRFRNDDCQESTEMCCKESLTKDPSSVKPYQPPEANKLRGCGYANPNGLDFTITGGTGREAQFGEYPWVIALLDTYNSTCAGVGLLIHPQVVLTAAHNVLNREPSSLKIRAGEWDTQTVKERLPHQERFVRDIVMHEHFVSTSLYNDIALIRLTEPVELADHINTACLPEQDHNFDADKRCVASGWGKDVFGKPGRYSVILKRIVIDMVNNGRCQEQLRRTRLGHRFRLHSSFVCAGGEEGTDTCQGDGGAPLVCPMGDNRYLVSGLVAWGIGCGQKDVPAVYARVAMFRNWIDDKMRFWDLDTSSYIAK